MTVYSIDKQDYSYKMKHGGVDMSVLFFKPIPRPAIWGHTLVKEYFGYDDFPLGIGQSRADTLGFMEKSSGIIWSSS